METGNKPKWYKRKGFLVALAFLGLFTVSTAQYNDSPSTSTQPVKSYTNTLPTHQTQPQIHATQDTGLSNDNYYTNSRGNTVHSPAYSATIPEGASAKCRDGTYSFSQSRRGTCSRHGGVATWL